MLEQGLGGRAARPCGDRATGAEVKIDGAWSASAPLRRDVLAGEHTVDLSAAGQNQPPSASASSLAPQRPCASFWPKKVNHPSRRPQLRQRQPTTARLLLSPPAPALLAGGAAIGVVAWSLAGLGTPRRQSTASVRLPRCRR